MNELSEIAANSIKDVKYKVLDVICYLLHDGHLPAEMNIRLVLAN